MGVLSDDYDYTKYLTPPSTAAASPTPTPSPTSVHPTARAVEGAESGLIDRIQEHFRTKTDPLMAGDEAAQIKRFGGVVGSPEYYAKVAGSWRLGSVLERAAFDFIGQQLPDQEQWDAMSDDQRNQYKRAALQAAGLKLAVRLPREAIKAPVRLGISIFDPWVQWAKTGRIPTMEEQRRKPATDLPWLGQVPSYWQTYDQAREAGLGPIAATVMTSSLAAGDAAISASMTEAVKTAFQPRRIAATDLSALTPEQASQITLQRAVATKPVNAAGSTAEYYSLPKTVQKKFGENSYLKVSPAGVDGSVEMSIVQVRGGPVRAAVDAFKGRRGAVTQGDFGPEIKLETVRLKGPARLAAAAPEGETAAGTAARVARAEDKLGPTIPATPLKGMADKPVTPAQVSHLSQIAQTNEVTVDMANAVVKSVTGKAALGDLTQAEYVMAAQALAGLGRASKFAGETFSMNAASKYVAPQNRLFRSIETTYPQFPVYTKGFVPIDDAFRVHDAVVAADRELARGIFGKYAGPGYAQERRLIKHFIEGDEAVISENTALSAEVKADLTRIAEEMRKLYREYGPKYGEKDLGENYQPHIRDIGGIKTLYKSELDIPEETKFFADYARHGSNDVMIDDALALWDIYTKAGNNKLFLNPALKQVYELQKTLPKQLQDSMKSFVQEKLGYAGKSEQALNDAVSVINRKLGLNLPGDMGRRVSEVYLNALNAGALGSLYGGRVGPVLRNALQSPLLVYPRLGPSFYAQAMADLTVGGKRSAILDEMHKRGLLEKLGTPYGQELVTETTLTGQVGTRYRQITQGSMHWYSAVDNMTRAHAYRQWQLQWDSALADFRSGKLSWPQFEEKLNFSAFDPIDQNIIRQRLSSGDTDGAFTHAAREIINETNFNYSRGASSRLTFGLAGKLGTKFLRWPVEYAHTLGRWFKTGQWDNIIRWYAASALMSRTFEDAFGIDFSQSFGFGPIKSFLGEARSPLVKAATEAVAWVSAMADKNKEAMDDHAEELAGQMSVTIPFGVDYRSWSKFQRAYAYHKEGNRGPNGEEWAMIKPDGRLDYWTTFSDVMLQALGFPTSAARRQRELRGSIARERFDYAKAKEEALKALRDGDESRFTELIQEYGLSIQPDDLDKYYIPINERTYQLLPAPLKERFAPQVFPQ